jgi:hypothetical protein
MSRHATWLFQRKALLFPVSRGLRWDADRGYVRCLRGTIVVAWCGDGGSEGRWGVEWDGWDGWKEWLGRSLQLRFSMLSARIYRFMALWCGG